MNGKVKAISSSNHTWIFEAVSGSRNDLIVPHNILKPWPAFMMYNWCKVCKSIQSALESYFPE